MATMLSITTRTERHCAFAVPASNDNAHLTGRAALHLQLSAGHYTIPPLRQLPARRQCMKPSRCPEYTGQPRARLQTTPAAGSEARASNDLNNEDGYAPHALREAGPALTATEPLLVLLNPATVWRQTSSVCVCVCLSVSRLRPMMIT